MDMAERFERSVGRPGYYQDFEVDRSEGNYLIDTDGERYVDFVAGWCVVNAGYGREDIIARMAEFAERAGYVKTSYVDERTVTLAERLADMTPGNLQQTFRVPSGTEAVDLAIKASRLYTGKSGILSNENAYHGMAYGAMSAGYDSLGSPFAPLVPGFERIRTPDFTEEWYEEFEEAVTGDVAAYMTETVLTHQGVVIPPEDHYRRIREICDDHEVLLVLDEVANGFGRTGKMFAAEHYGAEPDIMALAKGMTSGYAPAGAAVMREDIGAVMSNVEMSAYSTFGWVPSAVGATTENIEILRGENLAEKAREKGRSLEEKLLEVGGVQNVRRKGLLVGVVIEEGKNSDLRDRALRNNVLVGTTNDDSVVLLSPPLNINESYLNEGVDRIREAIR